MSLHPRWIELILKGEKTREVRKRAPLLRQPFKVYLYCTKCEVAWMAGVKGRYPSYRMNGMVCGEAICTSIMDMHRPFYSVYGTCLTAKKLYEYAGASDKLSYMALSNPVLYENPVELSAFGLEKAPQSWVYVEEISDGNNGKA